MNLAIPPQSSFFAFSSAPRAAAKTNPRIEQETQKVWLKIEQHVTSLLSANYRKKFWDWVLSANHTGHGTSVLFSVRSNLNLPSYCPFLGPRLNCSFNQEALS
jgi:hypothetical protein